MWRCEECTIMVTRDELGTLRTQDHRVCKKPARAHHLPILLPAQSAAARIYENMKFSGKLDFFWCIKCMMYVVQGRFTLFSTNTVVKYLHV